MADKKTTRVQLEMADTAYARLNSLKERTEAVSYSEVVKNALRLYDSLMTQHEAGRTMMLRDNKTGEMVEYVIFL